MIPPGRNHGRILIGSFGCPCGKRLPHPPKKSPETRGPAAQSYGSPSVWTPPYEPTPFQSPHSSVGLFRGGAGRSRGHIGRSVVCLLQEPPDPDGARHRGGGKADRAART